MSRPAEPDARRAIPAVDRLLGSAAFQPLYEHSPRALVASTLQALIDEVRTGLAAGRDSPPVVGAAAVADPAWYAARVAERLVALRTPSLRRMINATGVILHTNLGRAPLAEAARAAVLAAAEGYANLEYDLAEGRRGSRMQHCVALLRQLTGAQDALVVNNNAAALVLALGTVAAGREVILSRGELVEIGDSFRIAAIIGRSGARLREVGATNRTHAGDYRAALGEHTGALLKVHRSNFRMSGFTAEVGLDALAPIAREAGVPLVHDAGSGLLLDAAVLGLPPEPTVRDALEGGADLVLFSGDKLLGGPQAGILAGSRALITACRQNPLHRALRIDKLTLAALAGTLALYLDPARALAEIPVLRMLRAEPESLAARAEVFAAQLRTGGIEADTVPGESSVGGGAYPDHPLPSRHVRILLGEGCAAAERALRAGDTPVLVRTRDGALRLDLRTVAPGEEEALLGALRVALA